MGHKDGKTRGYRLLLLATPFRGRAIPCGFVTYSSKTIAQLQRSRNQYHRAAFDQVKVLFGDKPLVLDREFSYLELLEYLVHVRVNFVIRVHLGCHPPTFCDAAGRKVVLTAGLGAQVVFHQLRYMDKVLVNVVGVWRKGHRSRCPRNACGSCKTMSSPPLPNLSSPYLSELRSEAQKARR